MTVAPGTVALYILGTFLDGFIDDDETVASSKKKTPK